MMLPTSSKNIVIKVQSLPIDGLVTDVYQRPLSAKKVNTIVKEYNPYKLDPLKVSLRDGKFYVIDGQHRVIALKSLGIKEVSCQILTGLTQEEEAEIFRTQGEDRSNPNSLAKHKAAVIAKNSEALKLEQVMCNLGLKIVGAQKALYGVSSIGALYGLLQKEGSETLETVLRVIKNTWEGNSDSLQKVMIMGVYNLLKRFDNVNEKTFIKQMKKVDPVIIIREGKSVLLSGSNYEGYVQALQKYYNKNLKSGNKLE